MQLHLLRSLCGACVLVALAAMLRTLIPLWAATPPPADGRARVFVRGVFPILPLIVGLKVAAVVLRTSS